MKTYIAIIAASALTTSAYAEPNGSFVDNHDTQGTILADLSQPSSSGEGRYPTGELVPIIATGSSYGSILFDLDQESGSRTMSTQPSIGDDADDYGNILYDTGSRY